MRKGISLLNSMVLVFSLLFTLNSWADLATLKSVASQTTDGHFVTRLQFDQPLQGQEYSVDYINETVQVNIPGALIKSKKRLERLKTDTVKSLYTYQVDEDLLRHRIILNSGNAAVKLENQVQIEKDGANLFIRIPRIKNIAAEKTSSTPSTMASIIKSLPKKVKIKEEKRDRNSAGMMSPEEEEMKKIILSSEAIKSAPIKTRQVSLQKEAKATSKVVEGKELSESEIPVLAGVKKESKASSSLSRMLISLGVVLLVGLGAFLGLKRFQHKGLLKSNHTSIKMLTQHYIGPKKSLAIIQVAGESILVGVTDHSITHIKTLALLDEEVPELAKQPFADSLESNAQESNTVAAQDKVASAPADADEFSIKGIKDLVSTRLNGMRDI